MNDAWEAAFPMDLVPRFAEAGLIGRSHVDPLIVGRALTGPAVRAGRPAVGAGHLLRVARHRRRLKAAPAGADPRSG